MDRLEMDRWPNFFIVGAPRAGTTSLHEYLNDIPGIFMSPIKEPNYFSRKLVPDDHLLLNPIREKSRYLSLFDKTSNEKIVGEASPLYLSDPEASQLIHDFSPNALILMSLRDPIERILSHFTLIIRDGGYKGSFHNKLLNELKYGITDNTKPHLYLEAGLYSESVKRYLEIFGPKQVKIIIFEEFIKNPKKILEEILDFLNISENLSNFKFTIHNPFTSARDQNAEYILTSKTISKFSKLFLPFSTRKFLRQKILTKKQEKPILEENDRKILYEYYHDDVKKLKNILTKDLPWPNFQK